MNVCVHLMAERRSAYDPRTVCGRQALNLATRTEDEALQRPHEINCGRCLEIWKGRLRSCSRALEQLEGARC